MSGLLALRGLHPGLRFLALAGLLLGIAPLGPLRAQLLLPVDGERFRGQYGQEALFRLRLGVDAGSVTPTGASPPARCPAPDWDGSAEQHQYNQALKQGSSFEAGKALGRWQRQQSLCRPQPR